MNEVEKNLLIDLEKLYAQMLEIGHDAKKFKSMLYEYGPVNTIKIIVSDASTSTIYKLLILEKKELTVESFVIRNPQYHSILGEEIVKISERRMR